MNGKAMLGASVLVELPKGAVGPMTFADPLQAFQVDQSFSPVPLKANVSIGAFGVTQPQQETVVFRVTVRNSNELDAIKQIPDAAVWADPKIEAFPGIDCQSNSASATSAQIAAAIGAERVWNEFGTRGAGVGIGIVDGGVDQSKFPMNSVVGGWTPDPRFPPGSGSVAWNGHGNMCAYDALIACPGANLYDYSVGRTLGVAALLSAALQAYQAALVSYNSTGQPRVLSNSWGLYQQSWDPFPPGQPGNYTHDLNHPFNRKVYELMDAGVIVVFAAGNCGEVCADSRCGTDIGPARSIRGANGMPRSICVGAANIRREWIGYSSQGPSTLDTEKPDVCGYSHFQGYSLCDNGTSAACPVVAGALGLLVAVKPAMKQDEARSVLRKGAVNPAAVRWDARFGRGIVDAYASAQLVR